MWDDFAQEEIRLVSQSLLDRGSSRVVRVERILLFGQRARRRPVGVVGKVPRLGASLRGVEEEQRVAVVRVAVARVVVTAVVRTEIRAK